MELVRDFNIEIDRANVLRAVSSYYDISSNFDINRDFNNLKQLALNSVRPLGVFEIEEMPKEMPSSFLKNCNRIIYCLFTIGDEITDITDGLFTKNEFEKAIVLDAISTSILFSLSKQFYNKIYDYASYRKLGLTCRIAPGDGEIDISFQRDIVLKFDNYNDIGFKIISDYLVKPYKSLTYLYGADDNIKINKEDHNCNNCSNINCFMRNSTQKIRGPFEGV